MAVEAIVKEPEVGEIYTGKVKRIMDFGAFVEFLPGKEGLVHISKLSRDHVSSVQDVLQEGQEIQVKLIEVDRLGRVNLSYIDAIDPDGSSRPSSSGGSQDRQRGRDTQRRDDRSGSGRR